MAAATHTIILATGEDFSFDLTIEREGVAVDVAGDTFTAEVRRDSRKPLEASFTCSIIGDGSAGQVRCVLPAAETSKLDGYTRYKWDLFRDTGVTKTQLIKGDVEINNNISNI